MGWCPRDRGSLSSFSSPSGFRHTHLHLDPEGTGPDVQTFPRGPLCPCLPKAGHPGPPQGHVQSQWAHRAGQEVTPWSRPSGTSRCYSPVSPGSPVSARHCGRGMPRASPEPRLLRDPPQPPYLRRTDLRLLITPRWGGPQTHLGAAIAILLGSIGWCQVSNAAW